MICLRTHSLVIMACVIVLVAGLALLGAASQRTPAPQTAPALTPLARPLPAPRDAANPPADAAQSSTGLVTPITTPETGTSESGARDPVTVHYTGGTTDSKAFDSSYAHGRASTFFLNAAPKAPPDASSVSAETGRMIEGASLRSQPSASSSMVRLFVARLERPSPFVDALPVYCDDKEMVRIGAWSYFLVMLGPGKHTFRSTDGGSPLKLDLKDGVVYYLHVASSVNGARLEEWTTEDFNSYIYGLRPVRIGDIVDRPSVARPPGPTSDRGFATLIFGPFGAPKSNPQVRIHSVGGARDPSYKRLPNHPMSPGNHEIVVSLSARRSQETSTTYYEETAEWPQRTISWTAVAGHCYSVVNEYCWRWGCRDDGWDWFEYERGFSGPTAERYPKMSTPPWVKWRPWVRDEGLCLINEPWDEHRMAALKVLGDRKASEPDRRAAVKTLRQVGDARDVPLLADASSDRDSMVRASAVETLGLLRDTRALQPVIVSVKDEDRKVREAAVGALGLMNDTRSVDALIAVASDPKSDVRTDAVKMLAVLREPLATEVLVAAMVSREKGVALSDVADALGEMALGEMQKRQTVDSLIAALEDRIKSGEVYWVRSIASALAKLKDPRAVDALTVRLRTEAKENGANVENLIALAHAVAQVPDPRAVTALLEAFGEVDYRNAHSSGGSVLSRAEDRELTKELTDGLARMRDPRVVQFFVDLLKDERHRDTALRLLPQATGVSHPQDRRQWEKWWKENEKSFR